MAGTVDRGGSTVLDTASLPDGVLLKRCGNRRESVCPSCSYEYRGDAWQLLRAGSEDLRIASTEPEEGPSAPVGGSSAGELTVRTRRLRMRP